MARRLTTNQEIAGSIPASINNYIRNLRACLLLLLGLQDLSNRVHLVFDVQHLQITHDPNIIFSGQLGPRSRIH
jgi:hypothetical protein